MFKTKQLQIEICDKCLSSETSACTTNSNLFYSCKIVSDLRRHREFHNAVLSYQCEVEGCNFTARAIQTVKRHHKVHHLVRLLSTMRCYRVHQCKMKFVVYSVV